MYENTISDGASVLMYVISSAVIVNNGENKCHCNKTVEMIENASNSNGSSMYFTPWPIICATEPDASKHFTTKIIIINMVASVNFVDAIDIQECVQQEHSHTQSVC